MVFCFACGEKKTPETNTPSYNTKLRIILEHSVPDFLESLTEGSRDAVVETALAEARAAEMHDGDAVEAFANALNALNGPSMAQVFASSALQDKVAGLDDNGVKEVIRAELANAVENSYDVIRSRVDRFGVAQPNIQKLGGGQGRILVELPEDEFNDEVIKLLTASSNLQFWPTFIPQEMGDLINSLTEIGNLYAENNGGVNPFEGRLFAEGGIVAVADFAGRKAIDKALEAAKLNGMGSLPSEFVPFWSAETEGGMYSLYAIYDEGADRVAPLQGDVVAEASAGFQHNTNKPCVNMKMTNAAAGLWAELTGECAKESRPIAVVLDKRVYSAPIPSERLSGGSIEITGDFTIKETQNLAIVLSSGKMCFPMEMVESQLMLSVTPGQVNLEFWPTCTPNEIAQFVFLELKTVIMNETGDESLAQCLVSENGVVAYVEHADKEKFDNIIVKAKDVLPKNVILLWSAKPLVEKYSPYDDTLYEKYYLYAIKDDCSDGIAPLQGDFIENAEIGFSGNSPVLNITMDKNATRIWADMTEECAQERRPIAIVANAQVLSAPLPIERITGGRSVISGDFTLEEVQAMVAALK